MDGYNQTWLIIIAWTRFNKNICKNNDLHLYKFTNYTPIFLSLPFFFIKKIKEKVLKLLVLICASLWIKSICF